MPKVSAEHLEARRAEIIDAARRLFSERGFARTTMGDVVAESGLSNGAVYHYFPSKTDLVLAAATGHDGLVDGVAPAEPAGDLMRRLVGYVAPGTRRGHARFAAHVWGEAAVMPELNELVVSTHTQLQEQFAAALATGGDERGPSERMNTAQVCLAAVIGLAALVAAGIEVDLDDFTSELLGLTAGTAS